MATAIIVFREVLEATLIVIGGLMLLTGQVRGSAVNTRRPERQSQAGPAE